MKEIVCKVCGKKFTTNRWNASMCSAECKRERRRQYSANVRQAEREYRKQNPVIDNRFKVHRERKTDHMEKLTRDAIQARKEGLTYGRYMARRKAAER